MVVGISRPMQLHLRAAMSQPEAALEVIEAQIGIRFLRVILPIYQQPTELSTQSCSQRRESKPGSEGQNSFPETDSTFPVGVFRRNIVQFNGETFLHWAVTSPATIVAKGVKGLPWRPVRTKNGVFAFLLAATASVSFQSCDQGLRNERCFYYAVREGVSPASLSALFL